MALLHSKGPESRWPKVESLEACKALCIEDMACTHYVYHTEFATKYGNWQYRCVHVTDAQITDAGRKDPDSWPDADSGTSGIQSSHISGTCSSDAVDGGEATATTTTIVTTTTAVECHKVLVKEPD